MLMSRNGVGTCWFTTRIISSGVTPLAASAPTNEPALVPTYTSNSFSVRFVASRSRARSAPISYTPPVTPPPPRTRAVRERRLRRRGGLFTVERSRRGFSSLTTLPTAPVSQGYRSRPTGLAQRYPRPDRLLPAPDAPRPDRLA